MKFIGMSHFGDKTQCKTTWVEPRSTIYTNRGFSLTQVDNMEPIPLWKWRTHNIYKSPACSSCLSLRFVAFSRFCKVVVFWIVRSTSTACIPSFCFYLLSRLPFSKHTHTHNSSLILLLIIITVPLMSARVCVCIYRSRLRLRFSRERGVQHLDHSSHWWVEWFS